LKLDELFNIVYTDQRNKTRSEKDSRSIYKQVTSHLVHIDFDDVSDLNVPIDCLTNNWYDFESIYKGALVERKNHFFMSDKHKLYLKKFVQKKSISFKHSGGNDALEQDEKYRNQNFAKHHKNKW